MLALGQTVTLSIEKPAVGGWMIGRVEGQIVLVDGALPGERVSARIDRTARGVAYAHTTVVEEPSPDRTSFIDRACGGCLYAHIAYRRQLEIKSLVIADAFARIARLQMPGAVNVAASPVSGYRMRARFHRLDGRLGFFREGTHELCDARPTGQLAPATCDVLDGMAAALSGLPPDAVREVEIAENLDGSQRVVHVHGRPDADLPVASLIWEGGVTGVTATAASASGWRTVVGTPYVYDTLDLSRHTLRLRRHVLAFFQGNRFLLGRLVAHVVEQLPHDSDVIDLYAGGGLFSVAAARLRAARVQAVEGDRIASDDLAANAIDGVTPAPQVVETFVRTAARRADVVVVDPPRTGMSREALTGVVRLAAPRIVYVSCDVATLARDARRLHDAAYHLTRIDAFDLFPNTPHVETVVVFSK